MKKLLISLLLVFSVMTVVAQEDAQGASPVERHSVSTNPFFSNWFLQANFGGNVNYDNNLGFSVAIGKWFTPGIGLRTKYSISRYNILSEHVLFNLSNMFYGYNDRRVWSLIPYVGAGWRKLKAEDHHAFGYTLGLWNRFRVSRKIALNVDVSYGVFQRTSKDRMLNMEVGLTYSIGSGTWGRTPNLDAVHALYESEIDALNAQLQDAYSENDELRRELEQRSSSSSPSTSGDMSSPVE